MSRPSADRNLTGPIAFAPEVLRSTSVARSVDEVERALARIWSSEGMHAPTAPGEERRIGVRTNMLNLVAITGTPELTRAASEIVAQLEGRPPSRSLLYSTEDPSGPAEMEAAISAACMVPQTPGGAETCTETILLTARGALGEHLESLVEPLLAHDLAVALWWPGDPPFETDRMARLLALADRLVIDGSSWAGTGLDRLAALGRLVGEEGSAGLRAASTGGQLAVFDFALMRQARWREAIASVYDTPEVAPYLRSIRRITVDVAAPQSGSGLPNLVRPTYHVAWLASRLDLHVVAPLTPDPSGTWQALLRGHEREVEVVLRPLGQDPATAPLPPGSTLRVELLSERRGSTLRTEAGGRAKHVRVRAWENGVERAHRVFLAPRPRDVDLLGRAIEEAGRDEITLPAIRTAAALAGGDASGNAGGARR